MKDLIRLAVYERDHGICGFCQQPVEWNDLHIDHIVPVVVGGQDATENLRTAHSWCNTSAAWNARVLNRKEMPAPKQRILLNLPEDLANRLRDLAERERRPLSTQIEVILERALAEAANEAPTA